MTTRKTIELKTKASALANELAAWTAAAVEKGDLEKHHSQVARISAQINSAMEVLVEEIENPKPGQAAEEIEARILDLHKVWNFFRSKLVLRSFRHFRDYLAIADELAYDCYKPVTEARGEGFREPPLTFFNEESSPYAMARNRSYAFAIAGGSIANEAASALLQSLPVPVIGIPWFQQGHLPDLAIVAHEAGHHVEDDLELAPQLDLALNTALNNANLDAVRLAAWLSWRGEVFADVYATLAIGRAFPFALLDFLTSSDVQAVSAETIAGPPWGSYPTAPLRIAVTREVLRTRKTLDQEFEDRTKVIRQHAMSPFDPDCALVVQAMLATKLQGGKKVSDLLDFGLPRENNASDAATAALNEGAIQPKETRELVAAAVLAWTGDPKGFHEGAPGNTPQEKIMERIRTSIAGGTRSIPLIEKQIQTAIAKRSSDAAAGCDLLATLRGKRAGTMS
jgi:hypothetical protein